MAWAKEQARIETEKFELEKENHCIPITFHPNRKIPHGERRKFEGGYLFLQSLYYELALNKVCRKIRDKHHYSYDLNAILSDLIYTRILEPGSKLSSFETSKTSPSSSAIWFFSKNSPTVFARVSAETIRPVSFIVIWVLGGSRMPEVQMSVMAMSAAALPATLA